MKAIKNAMIQLIVGTLCLSQVAIAAHQDEVVDRYETNALICFTGVVICLPITLACFARAALHSAAGGQDPDSNSQWLLTASGLGMAGLSIASLAGSINYYLKADRINNMPAEQWRMENRGGITDEELNLMEAGHLEQPESHVKDFSQDYQIATNQKLNNFELTIYLHKTVQQGSKTQKHVRKIFDYISNMDFGSERCPICCADFQDLFEDSPHQDSKTLVISNNSECQCLQPLCCRCSDEMRVQMGGDPNCFQCRGAEYLPRIVSVIQLGKSQLD